MKIEKQLPFDFCDTCPEFVLKVDENNFCMTPIGNEKLITVYCKNAGKCKHLAKNLKKKGMDN